MVRWIRQPLPRASPFHGTVVAVRAVMPRLQAALSLMAIAGPILGVIGMKVLIFGGISAAAAGVSSTVSAAHQILFSAPTSRALGLLYPFASTPSNVA